MADNVAVKPSTDPSAVPIRTDEVGGAQYQIVKLAFGSDGSVTIIDAANGLPVVGTVALDAATLAALETINVANFPGTQPVSGTVSLSTGSLSALENVSVDNFPTTQNVSGMVALDAGSLSALETISVANFPATQTVSGTVALDAGSLAALETISVAALPLPPSAATDALQALGNASISSIDGKLPALGSTIPNDSSAGLPVRQIPADLWRVSFAAVGSGVQTAEIVTTQSGVGQTVSQAGGSLVIASGVTINSETLLRSSRVFRGAHTMRYRLNLSQRIANHSVEIALADLIGDLLAYSINSATSVTVTFSSVNPFTAQNVGQGVNISAITSAAGVPMRGVIASVTGLTVTLTVAGWPATGAGTLTLWGHNYHRVLYNGTTATAALYDAQRRGWNSGDTTMAINTTAAPGHIGHLQSMGTISGYSDALAASSVAYQFTPRASRLENLPDDTTDLYLFIRVLNGSTAPASTTTMTLGFVGVEMMGRQKVFLSGGDQMGAPMATGVQIVGGAVSISGTPVVDTELPAAAALADGAGNPTTPTVGATMLAFNGTTFDRFRTNTAVSVEASSLKSASGNGATLTNHNGTGVLLFINVTAVTGTAPTLAVRLQVQDPVSLAWVDAPGAVSVSITAVGLTLLSIYPGIAVIANSAISFPLPRVWRLAWTLGGTTPNFTFSVGAQVIE